MTVLGDANRPPAAWCTISMHSLLGLRPYMVWWIGGGDGYGMAMACIWSFFM